MQESLSKYRTDSRQLERVRPDGKPPRWYHWILFLPVFLITKIYMPFFRKDHPWKTRPTDLSLHSWVYKGTDISLKFSISFWCLFFYSIVLTLFIVFC